MSVEDYLASKGYTIDTNLFPLCQFRFPLIGVILYLMVTFYFQPPANNPGKVAAESPSTSTASQTSKSKKAKSKDTKPSITGMKLFMFVHNSLLCMFSALCFYNTSPIISAILFHDGFNGALCGKQLEQLYSNGIDSVWGLWVFLFYLSKFYEFIDTFIVIARGRRPILLQTFHHCGAVLGMWGVLVTQCTGGYLFVVENSFIHTIMYFYYAMSSINIRVPGKFIITQAQMIQFVIGNSIALVQLFGYADCMRFEDKFVISFHVIYTTCLLLLFRAFYKKTYKKSK
mmetsp:Transcript_18370/g.29189  ORF Transcript_18370/g.29189 Transcript_18370/m.29189 type:complete len:286 (+) Transcript_18370:46-903(+)